MTDKKVVIKINKVRSKQIQPKMVTVWNKGRIVMALALIVIIVVSIYYLYSADDEKNPVVAEEIKPLQSLSPENNTPVQKDEQVIHAVEEKVETKIDITTEAKNVSVESISSEENIEIQNGINNDNAVKVLPVIFDSRVSRSMLAKDVNNKEPVGELSGPVVVYKTKAVGVYYFTEINNMKGQVLFHEWYRNNKLVFKRKINILGNRWRASTSKLLPYSAKGNWLVKLVDESENILSKVEFQVI